MPNENIIIQWTMPGMTYTEARTLARRELKRSRTFGKSIVWKLRKHNHPARISYAADNGVSLKNVIPKDGTVSFLPEATDGIKHARHNFFILLNIDSRFN